MWHLRFEHLSFGGLKLLSKKRMAKGCPLQVTKINYVKDSYLKNMFEKVFQRNNYITNKPLQLIHVGIYGPIHPNSLLWERTSYTLYWWFKKKNLSVFFKEKCEVFNMWTNWISIILMNRKNTIFIQRDLANLWIYLYTKLGLVPRNQDSPTIMLKT